MHLVTFRRGRGEPKPGAVWHDVVLDLGGLAKELAAQRGTLRRGRGAFPRTLLELIRGGDAGMVFTGAGIKAAAPSLPAPVHLEGDGEEVFARVKQAIGV